MSETEKLIYNTVIAAGFPANMATLFISWAKHETGNFTSNFYKKYHNLFGYSYVAGAKWQLPVPGTTADNGQPIAAYASDYNSIMENIEWIKRRQKDGKFPADLSNITTPGQFALLLKNSGYYGDTLANYTAGLKRWFTSLPGAATGGIALIAVIAAAYLSFRS